MSPPAPACDRTERTRIRVRYPAGADDRIVLRTSLDWERDIAPILVDDARTTWVFDLGVVEQPPVYFKACRVRRGEIAWAVGANRVAWPRQRDVYPFFDSADRGSITERILAGERVLRVYLPPGYEENRLKRYPSLYLHDGANVFFPEEAFTGVEWQVDESLDALEAMNIADKVIAVAVYASPDRREEDYTQLGWETYANELVGVVKPLVDGRFRTLEGPEHTAVMGSSFGGVISLYLAWQRPEVFGMCACTSPSFGMRDDLLHRVCTERLPPIRVWIDSGWPGDNFERAREMADALRARGLEPGRDVLHFAFPGAEHHERSWAERVHLPLQFLFGDAFRRR